MCGFQSRIASRTKKDGACMPTGLDSPTVLSEPDTPSSPDSACGLGSHGRSENHDGPVVPPDNARRIVPHGNALSHAAVSKLACKMIVLLRKLPHACHGVAMFATGRDPVDAGKVKPDAAPERGVCTQDHELLTVPRQGIHHLDKNGEGWPQ